MRKFYRPLTITVRPKVVGLAILALLLLFPGSGRAASSGALDLSFGNLGTAAIDVGSLMFQHSNVVLVQPDGKVILAGYARLCPVSCHSDFLVVRLNADGTLDSTFGTGGIVKTDFSGQTQNEAIYAAALQSDGKIVVAGGLFSSAGGGTDVLGFKLIRYLSDGTLDSTFGTGGKVYQSFDDMGGTPQAMFIQPDGKIVVAGMQGSMLMIARFNTNGSMDTMFGTNGMIVTTSFNISNALLARQSDGKIIIAGRSGTSTGQYSLIRFNSDGSLDGSFGNSGVVVDNFQTNFNPVIAVQADDKILVSGGFFDDVRVPPLKRFNANGSVDNSFVPNHGTIQNGRCVNCTQQVVKILVSPDGKFYLVGYFTAGNSPSAVTVSRYLSTGAIDYSYAFQGTSVFKHTRIAPNGNNNLSDVKDAVLQANGKIVITLNGYLPVNNGPQLHLLAIRLNATVTPPSVRGDFDGDGKTDFAVFRPSDRFWYILNSFDNSFFAQRYGATGDELLPGDYNYDKKTDFSVYRPTENNWYILSSLPASGGTGGGAFGLGSDIKVPGDYDGDGFANLAIFRDGMWTIRYAGLYAYDTSGFLNRDFTFQWGLGTDKPVPGDYDGDGRTDLAVFRPSNGSWYILRSSDGQTTSVQFGLGTDQPVPGDYDGDLKTDIAVFREGNWYILRSSDSGFVGISWGLSTDKPVAGDYDGDGKFDAAVFRPDVGDWYVLKSSDSGVISQNWGTMGDTPIPFAYLK